VARRFVKLTSLLLLICMSFDAQSAPSKTRSLSLREKKKEQKTI
jgi:hypothetical protein